MSSQAKNEPNEPGGSVNERQAAAADARARRALEGVTPEPVEGNLAVRALELANEQGEAPDATVTRAGAYLKFLKENQNG